MTIINASARPYRYASGNFTQCVVLSLAQLAVSTHRDWRRSRHGACGLRLRSTGAELPSRADAANSGETDRRHRPARRNHAARVTSDCDLDTSTDIMTSRSADGDVPPSQIAEQGITVRAMCCRHHVVRSGAHRSARGEGQPRHRSFSRGQQHHRRLLRRRHPRRRPILSAGFYNLDRVEVLLGPNAMIFAAAAAAGSSTARPRKPGPTGSLLARCQSTAMPVSATTDAETPLANGLGARINAAYERFNISATMSKAIAPGLIRRSAGSSATIPA